MKKHVKSFCDEKPDRLPANWSIAELGIVCENKVRQGPPENEAVPYIDIGSIDRDQKRIVETRLVDKKTAPTRARQWIKKGDVLVSMTRPSLNAVALVPARWNGSVASTGFDVLRPRRILSQWIFHRVRSTAFVKDICKNLQGVVYPAIRPKDVRQHIVPIPPLPEQRRIVDAIETHLTRLDAAVASLERVRANLKRARASVLKAAVEGRLVPTEAELARQAERSYEHASVLLERILEERRRRHDEAQVGAKRKKKYKPPVEPEVEGLPELPEGWVWATLDHLLFKLESGNSATATDTEKQRIVLRSSAIRQGSIDFSDHRFLPETAPKKPNGHLSPNDILFTRLSGSVEFVGNCALVPAHCPAGIEFPDRIFRGRCSDSICPLYVQHTLAEINLRKPLEEAAKSSAGHQRIGLSDLRGFSLPLPPSPEQARIATEIERRLSVLDSIEQTVEQILHRSERLRQSILKRAFEGKLVPQDPNDEPASELLARIRAEATR